MSSSQNRRQFMQPWPLCLMSFGKSKERAILPKYYTRVPSIVFSSTASSSLVQDCASNATLLTNVSPFNSQAALISDKRTSSSGPRPDHFLTKSTQFAEEQNHHNHHQQQQQPQQQQQQQQQPQKQQQQQQQHQQQQQQQQQHQQQQQQQQNQQQTDIKTRQQHYYADNLRNNHHRALNGSQIYDPLRKDREVDYKQLDSLLNKADQISDTRILMDSQDFKKSEAVVRMTVSQFEKEKNKNHSYLTQTVYNIVYLNDGGAIILVPGYSRKFKARDKKTKSQ